MHGRSRRDVSSPRTPFQWGLGSDIAAHKDISDLAENHEVSTKSTPIHDTAVIVNRKLGETNRVSKPHGPQPAILDLLRIAGSRNVTEIRNRIEHVNVIEWYAAAESLRRFQEIQRGPSGIALVDRGVAHAHRDRERMPSENRR